MKTKTRVFTLLISIFITTVQAEIIPLTNARQVAINSIRERVELPLKDMVIDETIILKSGNEPLIYLFNFSSPIGFIAISAESSTIPVLGYCLTNEFNNTDQPVQFSALFESYKEQIKFIRKTKAMINSSVSCEWSRLNVPADNFTPKNYIDEIPPLILSIWHQNFPYNEQCPPSTPVGCVAMAMGQVMKYWSYPTQGNGSHGYTHYNYGYLFADFGATTYHWANMPYNETTSNTDLSTMLFHCGVSVEMDYTTSGSGALLEGYDGAEQALKNFFKFDPSIHYEKKFQFSDSAWREMIITDLENGYPIIYGGWDGWTGHAWNLDGYEKVGDIYHYHMNWGWGGSYNGYFYLDDLSPGYHNYTGGQEAIFNIKPFANNIAICYPANTDYWTGSTNTTAKTQTSLVMGTDPEDGWMSFDASAIPDGAEIYAVSFNGFVFERYKPNWSITPVNSDPLTTGAAALHADIVAEQTSGYYYHRDESNINYPIDWRTYMLSGDVNADLQASLITDKFTVGIANDYSSSSRYIRFHGWNEANPPYLKIHYTAYGSMEGTITEFGNSTPVADVYITIGHYTDTTDASGYYYFPIVPIGSYNVIIKANEKTNNNGNPFFNDTLQAIIADGITTPLNIGLKWAEINVKPISLTLDIDPFETINENISITNNGPGTLAYTCHAEPERGQMLKDWDIEAATGDDVIYGVVSDGEYIWATGRFENYGDHKLYKLDLEGNLVSTYPQGTTSQFGMRRMTSDGTYLYSYDPFGFYKIDPADGSVETLFTNFPTGLYVMTSLGYVPGLGFVASYEDEDLFVFDESGDLLDRLIKPDENFHTNDMTFDSVNNCLWMAKNNTNFYFQYDMETESLTGLKYEVETFPNCSYQTTAAVFFSTDIFPGKAALCGMTYGNPINNFFAFELETWLQITNNKTGNVSGYAKGTINAVLEISAGEMTLASKSANVIIKHNAGNTDTLLVTINNNYTHGDLEGYVYRYGTTDPIQNATVSVNGQSDNSDVNGYYSITNIPIGDYDMAITSSEYINDTLKKIPICGITKQQNIFLKWAEIAVNPQQINITLPPGNTMETGFAISNTGPGDLEYDCNLEFQVAKDELSILVVDADLSHFDYFGNGEDYPFDEWFAYMMALDANGYSYTYHQIWFPWDNGPDLATMLNYDLIIWFSGEIYSGNAITTADESNLATFLDSGGFLFLSSWDYLSKYGWGPITLAPGDFAFDYLGLREAYLENWDIWNMGAIEGEPGSFAEGFECDFWNHYESSGLYPAELTLHDGTGLFNLTDPVPEGTVAVQYDGDVFKSVYTGISIALLENITDRANMIADLMGFYQSQWISLTTNKSGIVLGETKGSTDVGLLLNTNGLANGTYTADIQITHNGSAFPEIIPVTLTVGDIPGIDLKVYLQGPFDDSEMNTHLNMIDLIPLSQPFNSSPWNYAGTESVTSIPNVTIVDWVLVEFRDAVDAASATPGTRIERQAAFLLIDGTVAGLDGMSLIQMNSTISNNLFVVISHRNHLDIMSANPVTTTGGIFTYDFSTGETQVYGNNAAHVEITPGIWGMTSANGQADNLIDDFDNTNYWEPDAGLQGYLQGDFNLDGQVNNQDKDDFWFPNLGKGSQVP